MDDRQRANRSIGSAAKSTVGGRVLLLIVFASFAACGSQGDSEEVEALYVDASPHSGRLAILAPIIDSTGSSIGLYVSDGADSSATRVPITGSTVDAIAWMPNGDVLVAVAGDDSANRGQSTLRRVEIPSGRVVSSLDLGERMIYPGSIDVSPDGRTAVLAGQNGRRGVPPSSLLTLDLGSFTLDEVVTPSEEIITYPRFVGDRGELVYVAGPPDDGYGPRTSNLVLHDLNSGERQQLSDPDLLVTSADGVPGTSGVAFQAQDLRSRDRTKFDLWYVDTIRREPADHVMELPGSDMSFLDENTLVVVSVTASHNLREVDVETPPW